MTSHTRRALDASSLADDVPGTASGVEAHRALKYVVGSRHWARYAVVRLPL